MFSGTIKCMTCGSDNIVEVKGIVTTLSETENTMFFRYKPYTGYLYYRCTACNVDMAIDPVEAVGSKMIQGLSDPSRYIYHNV